MPRLLNSTGFGNFKFPAFPDPWPNVQTTGVQPGITLTPSGSIHATAGQLIQNMDVAGTIFVLGDGVIIRNCRVNAAYDFFGITGDAFNFTVQNCEVFNCSAVCITINGGLIEKCNIYHGTKSIGPGDNCLIQYNFMHDLQGNNPLTGHFECIDIPGPVNNTTIFHNRMEAIDTACVFMKTDGGAISNVIINNNLMIQQAGIPSAINYAEPMASIDTGPGISGIVCCNNIMQAGFSGSYGDIIGNHVNWSANTDYFTGALIPNPGP
jgi:hypothetical protein